MIAEEIRVRGTVQGVGFRPTVYRLARACHLRGEVFNDGQGVLIRAVGSADRLDHFVQQLQTDCPPLAKIEAIARSPFTPSIEYPDFSITTSIHNTIHTGITPDAATCPQCKSEIFDPLSRWYRYPFTNCTHCGPRLSIVKAIPYDRRNTSMASFPLCADCARAYGDVGDRRFHAQPVACYACGPRAWLERSDGRAITSDMFSMLDDVDAVCTLLQRGEIVAIKGIGGIHLACDATQETAVQTLRQRKHRFHKPFALMARDLEMIERYCQVSAAEVELLQSPAAPIVLLQRILLQREQSQQLEFQQSGLSQSELQKLELQRLKLQQSELQQPLAPAPRPEVAPRARWGDRKSYSLAPSLSPGIHTLGFMLPYTPLHHLILKRMDRPIVLTSGNLSDEPQCIDNDEARQKLGTIADYFLLHNRDIVNRVDDSVVRVLPERAGGRSQLLRRARGYAPAPLRLPDGFEAAPPMLSLGGELKSTLCLIREGEAILSQHLGDLENAAAFAAYQQTLELYLNLFEHRPVAIALDLHPEYLSSKLGQQWAADSGLKIHRVQHHHAHVAACMAENGLPLNTPPVLGIALDGLGYGDDGSLWGGEFLLADYRGYQRLSHLQPIALLGGAQAIHQPWRNTYAHLIAAFGDWETLQAQFGELELVQFLSQKPRSLLNTMLTQQLNSPLASSAGRLFDAVAAALGLCRASASYEGQGAVELEALIDPESLNQSRDFAYPLAIAPYDQGLHLSCRPLWRAVLSDLQQGLAPALIAARFHLGFAEAIADLVDRLRQSHLFTQVALTGGVFQNVILTEAVSQRLHQRGFTVLLHHHVPCNDGGLSLGQGAIAAARELVTPSF